MKRTTTLLAGIVALAGGAAIPAHATTMIEQSSFSGSQASLFLSASTTITCADGVTTGVGIVSAQVFGAEQIQSSRGSPQSISNGTFVEVFFYFNSCTGVFFEGDGGIANSFTPPDKKLTSASMDGTGSIQDFDTGSQFAMDVNVSMTGTGSTSSEKANSHSKITGTTHGNLNISHSQSANSNREASVSGTITIDTVTFDASQALFGELISNSSSSLSVSK